MGQDDGIERILVVVAHPDDIDFGAAGSVATWTDAGIEVDYCLVTDGDAGGHDETVPRAEMAEIRQREQTAAAKIVGVTELHFLGFPDGRVEPTLELRRDISRVIRHVRPQRVVSQSPERNFDRIYASHPDHLATGEAAIVRSTRTRATRSRSPSCSRRRATSRGRSPRSGCSSRRADPFVDITDVFDRKLEALRSHVSQHQDPDGLETLIRDWMVANARARASRRPPGRGVLPDRHDLTRPSPGAGAGIRPGRCG